MKTIEFFFDVVSTYSYLASTQIEKLEKEDPAIKDQLRANTDDAIARGAFGAPVFFVGDEMFWGNDRMHFIEAEFR